MQISHEQLEEFKELLKNQIGENEFRAMSDQEILGNAHKLLQLIKLIYKPITREELDFIEKRRAASSKED